MKNSKKLEMCIFSVIGDWNGGSLTDDELLEIFDYVFSLRRVELEKEEGKAK